MAKYNYYAVRKGFKPGIYTTWDDCKLQVNGFSRPEYKGFITVEEADRYMAATAEAESENDEGIDAIINRIDGLIKGLPTDEAVAFVDGSYNDEQKKAGYGVIIITSDGNKEKLYRAITEGLDSDFIALRNIAPELEAVKQAVNWAVASKKRKITIIHDLEGTGKWANGEFKANNQFTSKYVDFIAQKRKEIGVEFVKVPAHSGIQMNEEADQLAKRSLLEKGYKTYNDGSVYFVGLSVDDWKSVVELLNEENRELEECITISISSEEKLDNRTKLILHQGSNRITINCYRSVNSYVQGKHSAFLQRLIATAISLLENGESVVEIYNTYHAVDITRENVEVKFEELLPHYTGDTKSKHYANLMSAVYNTMLTGYRPDYTHLVTPVFRGYEYYLHRILCDKMGLTTQRPNGTNEFGFFDKTSAGSFECNSPNKTVLTTNQNDYLNDLYTNYHKVRHPYSHWAYEDVDSQVITEMTEARNLIMQGLQMFDRYYLLF